MLENIQNSNSDTKTSSDQRVKNSNSDSYIDPRVKNSGSETYSDQHVKNSNSDTLIDSWSRHNLEEKMDTTEDSYLPVPISSKYLKQAKNVSKVTVENQGNQISPRPLTQVNSSTGEKVNSHTTVTDNTVLDRGDRTKTVAPLTAENLRSKTPSSYNDQFRSKTPLSFTGESISDKSVLRDNGKQVTSADNKYVPPKSSKTDTNRMHEDSYKKGGISEKMDAKVVASTATSSQDNRHYKTFSDFRLNGALENSHGSSTSGVSSVNVLGMPSSALDGASTEESDSPSSHSESKYLKRKDNMKVVVPVEQSDESLSPTKENSPSTSPRNSKSGHMPKSSTYTVTLQAPHNEVQDNKSNHHGSPQQERKKVSVMFHFSDLKHE